MLDRATTRCTLVHIRDHCVLHMCCSPTLNVAEALQLLATSLANIRNLVGRRTEEAHRHGSMEVSGSSLTEAWQGFRGSVKLCKLFVILPT